MKVLQVIDTLNIGGAEKVLVTLSNIQFRKGIEVTVLTTLNPGVLATQLNQGIPLISLKRGWKFNPYTMYRFVVIASKFDIIHVHSAHNLRYVYLATKLWRLKTRLVFHEHFGNIEIDKSIKWHHKWILPHVTLIGVSEQICDWAVRNVRLPQTQVHLLCNIIKEIPIKRRNKLPSEITNLMVCSNIRRTKHIEFAIQVFKSYFKNHPAHLTIIGQVVDTDYFKEIKQMILENDLEDCIDFEFECNDIQPILWQYDIALHTPVSESGPLVLIEYLAQGLPFVSYKTGEITRMIESSFPEFILDTFMVEDWVKAIQMILQGDQRNKFRSMRAYYESNFSEETYFQNCQSIYQSALLT